jgi:hypothetical protein
MLHEDFLEIRSKNVLISIGVIMMTSEGECECALGGNESIKVSVRTGKYLRRKR